MKQLLIAGFLFLSVPLFAQFNAGFEGDTRYTAVKSGLNLRETPDANAAIVAKLPYGTKIVLGDPAAEERAVTIEGIKSYWRKVTYNGKTGYVAEAYLLPSPPPKEGVQNMDGYFRQLSPVFGSKLVVKRDGSAGGEGGTTTEKQLYKNGSASRKLQGWEFSSATYHLPGFTIEQAFMLARMLPEFKYILESNEAFPAESTSFKRGYNEHKITVDRVVYENGSFIRHIRIDADGDGFQTLEIYTTDNEAVIYYNSGI